MKPGSIDPGYLIFGRSTHVYHTMLRLRHASARRKRRHVQHAAFTYCRENDYTTCSRCGALISSEPAHHLDCDDDEEHPYCHDCYDELCSCVIREYHYKPAPIFYEDCYRYPGIELEIDRAGEDNSAAEKLMNIANRDDEHIYCKLDSSLDDGFEIVSHPMSLDYHRTVMPWREVMDKAIDLDYRSTRPTPADYMSSQPHLFRAE